MPKLLLCSPLLALMLYAQQGPPPGGGPPGGGGGRGPQTPPKNLKVLTPEDLRAGAMRMAARGLGVQCGFCHNQADFSSDEKPEKLTARVMFSMVKDINAKLTSANLEASVSCYTCHRGEKEPVSAPPANAEGGPRPNGGAGPGGPPPGGAAPPPQ